MDHFEWLLGHTPICSFFVDISGESIDVSAESRAVSEQAVVPSQVAVDNAYCPSYIIHGEQCARSNDVPLPSAGEDIAEHNAENNE